MIYRTDDNDDIRHFKTEIKSLAKAAEECQFVSDAEKEAIRIENESNNNNDNKSDKKKKRLKRNTFESS